MIRLNKSVELLDTPGILWPKFEDQTVGLRLALIGSIKDEILNVDELAVELVKFLKAEYPGLFGTKIRGERGKRYHRAYKCCRCQQKMPFKGRRA